MVKNGQSPIRKLAYRSPADGPFGIEVMSFRQLRAITEPALLTVPQRPEFHVLQIIEHGTGHQTADFRQYPLRPGSVLWIRPGQVHQFEDIGQVDGTLVLFLPDFLAPGTRAASLAADPFANSAWDLDLRRDTLTMLALEHLRTEYTDGAGDPLAERNELLRQLLTVLVLRITPRPGPPPTPPGDAFSLFRQAVERDFAASRQVAHYARQLGYSARTLTRATLAATGAGAKEFIDARVLLEAKRLLAHSDLTVMQCGHQLGFQDAANFSKFFEQRAGLTPGAFRASARG
jgi:AraC-like DNA-binding protein